MSSGAWSGMGRPMVTTVDLRRAFLAAHGLKARHHVLGVPGQQVSVVRQAVRKRRAVVEHKPVRWGLRHTFIDRRLERAVALPVVQHL